MTKKILVVDDEESIRYTFDLFLSDEGYDVTGAANYEDGLSHIQKLDFDLIFLDIVLEGKNGIDLLKMIRKTRPDAMVIMITGVPSIETAAESLRHGALDYIIKPIRQETLLRAVSVALKHKAVTEEKENCRLNFEAIFRSVKDGIVTVDESLSVVEINEAAMRLCDVERTEVIGESVQKMAHTCQGKCMEVLQEIVASCKPVEIRYVECYPENEKHQVVSLAGSPLMSIHGQFTGAVLLIRDETQLLDLKRSLKKHQKFKNIIGKSSSIRRVQSLIEDLAGVETTVLVTGESGTGKELVVEALHSSGDRRNGLLVKVNCAALSENLLESELFGHVAGAFTGAVKDKMGRFQRADGGTLFLDEIGDISSAMQQRLLRVIETMEFERVGDSVPVKVDVRVVAATNQDLKKKVEQGEFRQDLYYRLKVVEINLPSLRERAEDIPLLVEHFLSRFNAKFSKKIEGLSADTWEILLNHQWPGNVRELENTLEHAFIRCHAGVITTEHLPGEFRKSSDKGLSGQPRDQEQEAVAISRALRETLWNKSKAAELLGISRRTIYRKMQKYGIDSASV